MKKLINKKYLIIMILIILLSISYKTNFLVSKTEMMNEQYSETFENFQIGSENLVLSKIYQDKNSESIKWGLTYSYLKNDFDDNLSNTFEVLPQLLESNAINNKIVYKTYRSQFGLQGFIFSFLYNKLNLSLETLRIINCILLATVITFLCIQICKKYNKILGSVFYLTFFLSPWIISFAKNLYWVEFTWFLPTLFSIMLSKQLNKKKIYLPLIYISILIKCLCGYEYISTIMLFTISFYIIDFFKSKNRKEKMEITKTCVLVGIICILGFITSICIHANLKGNGDIIEGIKTIYKEDITRRTLDLPGSLEFVGTEFAESIESNLLKVIKVYFNWHTNIILGIDGIYFKPMVFLTMICVLYNTIKKQKNYIDDIIMFIIFFIAPLSWYILGKAHSAIHTHMNYVLWYFGFVQICLYINFKAILRDIDNIKQLKEEI